MKLKKNMLKKSKKTASSIILYAAASVTALIGVALLINNVLLYNNNVAQYVAQGYDVKTVTKQLISSQLIPGIFQPIGLYLGIAFLLLGAGIINQKISNLSASLTEVKASNDKIEESALDEAPASAQNLENVDVLN